jgi:hypothetical protein
VPFLQDLTCRKGVDESGVAHAVDMERRGRLYSDRLSQVATWLRSARGRSGYTAAISVSGIDPARANQSSHPVMESDSVLNGQHNGQHLGEAEQLIGAATSSGRQGALGDQ